MHGSRLRALALSLAVASAAGCTVAGTAPDGARHDAGPVPDAPACVPTCEGDDALLCDGTRETCDGACVAGRGCLACRPRSTSCDEEGRPVVCSDDGEPIAGEACGAGEICHHGACLDLCDDPERADASAGCEFWAVPTLNSMLGAGPRAFMVFESLGSDGFHYAIAIGNPNDSPVEVRVTGRDVDLTRRVAAGSVEAIVLPWVPDVSMVDPGGLPTGQVDGAVYRGTPSVLARGVAYHVTTNGPVVAYQFDPLNFADDEHSFCTAFGAYSPYCYSYTNDASLLLPARTLGRRYHALSRTGASEYDSCSQAMIPGPGGFVTIVGAAAEPTDVTVRAAVALRGGPGTDPIPAGATLTRTLAAGDVWQLVSASPATRDECMPMDGHTCNTRCTAPTDLTGTRIESSRPVAVFSGHDCANAPEGVTFCDHLEEQLLPYEALGRDHVAPPLGGLVPEGEPTLLRVLSTTDGTTITFEPESAHPSVVLDEGQFVEFEHFAPVRVRASAPVSVVQYSVGSSYFHPTTTIMSDPSMLVVPPVEQWRAEYPVLVPSTYERNFAIVIAPHDAQITIDDDAIEGGTRSGDLALYRLEVEAGEHVLRGTQPFSVAMMGTGHFVSYAYPGGSNVEPINEPF